MCIGKREEHVSDVHSVRELLLERLGFDLESEWIQLHHKIGDFKHVADIDFMLKVREWFGLNEMRIVRNRFLTRGRSTR